MHRTEARSMLVVLLLAVPASGATIISQTGPPGVNVAAGSLQADAVSWTALNSYTAVTISATLEGAGPDPGIAFLTTRIGPGATAASEVAVANFVFPDFDTSPGIKVQLFSGLTLAPGTYYLVLGSSMPLGGGWLSTTSPSITTDAGVTAGLNYNTSGSVNAAYPPGSSFIVSPNAFLFEVTGTPAPEPHSMVYPGLGLLMLWRMFRKSRRCRA